MKGETPETLAAEISRGRWLIVADTLDLSPPAPREPFSRMLELLRVVADYKRRIALFTAVGFVASMGFSWWLPNRYTATTQLLPPQSSQTASALLGQFSELASLAGKDVVKNPSALFVVLLRSRSIADRVIARFDLQKEYRSARLSDCRGRLEKRSQIELLKEGVIVIQTEDRDPRRAAELANAYVEELMRMNQKLAVGEASRRRLFFEGQVRETQEQLAKAEEAFRQAQESTGMLQLDTQAKAMIEAAAGLRTHIALKESQLETIRAFATEQNPDLVRVERELSALHRQLRRMQQDHEAGDLEVPVSQLPSAGLEYLRRLREVKYYEAVFEMLSKQLEASRLDEAREGSLIQVIDPAEIPDRKSGPRRGLITLLGTVSGLLAGLGWVAVRNAVPSAGLPPSPNAPLVTLGSGEDNPSSKNGNSAHR
jgi:tyrosine-protein kinase Etk/Wzc